MYFITKGKWVLASQILKDKLHFAEQIPVNKKHQVGERIYLILKEFVSPTYIGEFYIFT